MRPNTAIRRSFLLALAISSLMAAVLETTIQPGGQLRTHSLKADAAQQWGHPTTPLLPRRSRRTSAASSAERNSPEGASILSRAARRRRLFPRRESGNLSDFPTRSDTICFGAMFEFCPVDSLWAPPTTYLLTCVLLYGTIRVRHARLPG